MLDVNYVRACHYCFEWFSNGKAFTTICDKCENNLWKKQESVNNVITQDK